MPTIVQFRRGTKAQNSNFLGASGELSINTSENSIRVHDGSQTGGYELARADFSNVTTGILTSLSIGTGSASTEVISSGRSLNNIIAINATTKSTLASSLLLDSTLNYNTGILTATQLRVGSSLEIKNNNINTPSGIITAASYLGSGINLSGIVTSILAGSGIQITSNASGIVTVTATGSGGSGGGISAIQIQNNGTVVGSAGTFNFSDDFAVPIVGAGGIGTVSLSQSKTLNISAIQPATQGIGFIGTVGNSWSNGHFSNLTVDDLLTATKVLNIREALDLADGDILRFGTGDDVTVAYNGATDRLDLNLTNTAVDFSISNGGSAFAVFKRSSNRLGIGSETPTEALDVIGNIKSSQTVSAEDFNTTSDITLKTDICTIENALELISAIRGVRFTWKERLTPSLGVIAQEVEEVIPELVTDGDPKQVNYNGLIGVLVESVKELSVQIDNIKKENENIKLILNVTADAISELSNKL